MNNKMKPVLADSKGNKIFYAWHSMNCNRPKVIFEGPKNRYSGARSQRGIMAVFRSEQERDQFIAKQRIPTEPVPDGFLLELWVATTPMQIRTLKGGMTNSEFAREVELMCDVEFNGGEVFF